MKTEQAPPITTAVIQPLEQTLPTFLTVDQCAALVAELLDQPFPIHTCRKWLRAGWIPSYREGNAGHRYLIHKSDVVRWVRDGRDRSSVPAKLEQLEQVASTPALLGPGRWLVTVEQAPAPASSKAAV